MASAKVTFFATRRIKVDIFLKTIPARAWVNFAGATLGTSKEDGSFHGEGYWPEGKHRLEVRKPPEYEDWHNDYEITEDKKDIRETVKLKKVVQ